MGKKIFGISLFLLLSVAVMAAGCNFKPPEECPFSGSVDESAFDLNFTGMELQFTDGGIPEVDPESGSIFSGTDEIVLKVNALKAVDLQVCVTERKGGGKIVYSLTHGLVVGDNTVTVGPFDKNPYVMRLGFDNTLVKNFPFIVK